MCGSTGRETVSIFLLSLKQTIKAIFSKLNVLLLISVCLLTICFQILHNKITLSVAILAGMKL